MLIRPERNIPHATTPHQRSNGIGRLRLVEIDGKSCLDEMYQEGCAKIRIPRTAGNELEAVLINTSGGMTGGDRLNWKFTLGNNCSATATTQACERVYKAVAGKAQTDIAIKLNQAAQFSWLPQETILYDQGALTRKIDVDLAPTAEALLVEPLIFGRREMGENIHHGLINDRWNIKQNGRLIHCEALKLKGNISEQLMRPFMADSAGAIATVLLVSPTAESQLTKVRQIIGETGGASYWNGKLVARISAEDGYSLRNKLIPLINLLNFGAPVPKVWSL